MWRNIKYFNIDFVFLTYLEYSSELLGILRCSDREPEIRQHSPSNWSKNYQSYYPKNCYLKKALVIKVKCSVNPAVRFCKRSELSVHVIKMTAHFVMTSLKPLLRHVNRIDRLNRTTLSPSVCHYDHTITTSEVASNHF